jgi:hypothetical protein
MTRRIVLCAALLSAALTPTLRAAGPVIPAPSVPVEIAVDAGFTPFLRVHAAGTQNFICAPANTASGVDWFFLGPQATLFDDVYLQAGTHFLSKNVIQQNVLQATWQFKDTSTIWATRLAGSTDSAYVAPDAIEWLLLGVTGDQAGPTGGGKLRPTRFIHRVNTVGGRKPPSAECTPATINTRRFVNYEADYYFYR